MCSQRLMLRLMRLCRLGVGVIAFSWALFNIGVWLCHAYLDRKLLMLINIILGIASEVSCTFSCVPFTFGQLEGPQQDGCFICHMIDWRDYQASSPLHEGFSIELVVAAIDAPLADIRAELKEQLAEEAAQKAAAEQPKLPGSARAGSSPVNGHTTNGALVFCFALSPCRSYMWNHCATLMERTS